ncbi:MAG TPA: DNA repair protein RecO [Alphaproteobacteria bacterium]
MERWNDRGLVLSVRAHGENAAVVSMITEKHGRHAGYVHGGHASSRMRAALQPGAKLDVEWSAQTSDQLGAFAIQDDFPPDPAWLEDPARLAALQSVCAILDKTLPERERHPALFTGTDALFQSLAQDKEIWGAMLVYWELSLLRELGFGLDLSKCVVTGETENLHYVSPKSGGAVSEAAAGTYKDRLLKLPGFLRGEGQVNIDDVAAGLKLSGYFIEHRLLAHTTYTLPESRQRLTSFFDTPAAA